MAKIPVLIEYWPNPLIMSLRGDSEKMLSKKLVKFNRQIKSKEKKEDAGSDEIICESQLSTDFQKRISGYIFGIDAENNRKTIKEVTFTEYEINIKSFAMGIEKLEAEIKKALRYDFEFVTEITEAFKS